MNGFLSAADCIAPADARELPYFADVDIDVFHSQVRVPVNNGNGFTAELHG